MERVLEPEIMDDPTLDASRHVQALRGLARLNWLSGSSGILWPSIYRLSKELARRPIRILDVATGSADVPLGIWKRSQRAGVEVEILGTDISGTAIAEARRRCSDASSSISFREVDVLQGKLDEEFDIVISSLFMHHLTEAQAIVLLERMRAAARHLVLINDLRRCRSGVLLAWAAGRLFTRSDVVHVDGPLSAKAAFTMEEVRALALAAKMPNATVVRRWPCRFLFEWRPPVGV